MNLFIRNLFDNLISHLFLLKVERKEPLVEKHVGIKAHVNRQKNINQIFCSFELLPDHRGFKRHLA